MNKICGVGIFFILLSVCLLGQTEEAEEKNVSYAQVNQALGIPLFSEQDFWEEADTDIALRLKLRKESDTTGQMRFRLFDPGVVLGVTCTSLVLNSQNGKPDNMLIMFVNKGDSLGIMPEDARGSRDWEKKAAKLTRQIHDDADTVEKNLKELFGEHKTGKFGQSRETTEKVKVWTWKNCALLLAENKDESLSLRIVTPEVAKRRGAVEEVSKTTEVKKELKERVLRRENGDVVITDIPMVNQGKKGYCVPSTWARCLQYMGIPADEYTLANAGGTTGRGTNTDAMMASIDDLVLKNGRKLERFGGDLSINMVKKYIDNGIPIMWTMFVVEDELKMREGPTRMEGKTLDEYKEKLKEKRRLSKRLKTNPSDGHMCMIIGYNDQTDEIATSDSWGPRFAEEWNVVEADKEVSQKAFYAIKP